MKIKNGNMPAMPQCGATDTNDGQVFPSDELGGEGLTKREMFAMHAMVGIQACAGQDMDYDQIATQAVMSADALLAELDK